MAAFKPCHDDVIKWKHFPRYWPFVRGIHRSPANSPHKRQWHVALMFSLSCVWINNWVNNHEVGDLRRYSTHCDVTVMRMIELITFEKVCSVTIISLTLGSDSRIRHKRLQRLFEEWLKKLWKSRSRFGLLSTLPLVGILRLLNFI